MSKIILIALAIAFVAWLVCIDFSLKPKRDPFTWSDQNGCQYLVKQDTLTPRLNPNGTQICRK